MSRHADKFSDMAVAGNVLRRYLSYNMTGEMRVDFGRWGWFPQIGSVDLPGTVDLGEEDGEGTDE